MLLRTQHRFGRTMTVLRYHTRITIKKRQQKSEHTAHKNTDKTKDERRKGIDATKLLCSNDGTKCLRITQS
jgi:hypothetical protein